MKNQRANKNRVGNSFYKVLSIALVILVFICGCSSENNNRINNTSSLTKDNSSSSSDIQSSTIDEPINSTDNKINSQPLNSQNINVIKEDNSLLNLQELPMGAVQLTEGILKEKFVQWSQFYLTINNDDILYEFRKTCGIKNIPGKRLTGWSIQLAGYEVNEWISGFCYLYRITGNSAFKEKAITLADGWYECFLLGFDKSDLMTYNSHYTVKRWVDAFLDCYEYLGMTEAPEKIDKIYQWASHRLSFDNYFGDNSCEWYTLGESFYRAYLLTGNKKYCNYAVKWDYTEYWDMFKDINNITPFAKKPVIGLNTYSYHVISHVNSFNSAAEAFRVTGKDYYLNVIKNAFLWLKNDQIYPCGGIGAGYEWALPVDQLIKDLEKTHNHSETGSTSIYMRYARNLLGLTADSSAGDWIEKMIYNDTCSLLGPKKNGADYTFQSYHDYNITGGFKSCSWRGQDIPWTSGAATIPMEIAEFYRCAYFEESGSNIHVNLYTPSVLNWSRKGNDISLNCVTSYPLKNTATYSLSVKHNEEFSIRFRVPEWANQKIDIKINGKITNYNIFSSGWASVRRVWKNGDKITVELPMSLRLEAFSKSGYSTVMYGPVAMPVIAQKMTEFAISGQGILNLKRDNNLTFYYNNKPILKPYYNFKENEKYYMMIKGVS